MQFLLLIQFNHLATKWQLQCQYQVIFCTCTMLRKFLQTVLKSATWKNTMSGAPFTIAVEGNIGSGKSTFLKHIEKMSNSTVISEPVDQWRNCSGHNLLGLLYEDPQKWSFTFQSYVQLTMLQNHIAKVDTPIKLMERSIHSARYCFVEKLQRDGILLPPSFTVLDEFFKWICTNHNVGVDVIVYLRTSPEVAYQRVLSRNRNEEKSVPIDYLKSLHDIHENWLYHKTAGVCPAPVFVIDANLDLTRILNEYEKFESQILSKKMVLSVA